MLVGGYPLGMKESCGMGANANSRTTAGTIFTEFPILLLRKHGKPREEPALISPHLGPPKVRKSGPASDADLVRLPSPDVGLHGHPQAFQRAGRPWVTFHRCHICWAKCGSLTLACRMQSMVTCLHPPPSVNDSLPPPS